MSEMKNAQQWCIQNAKEYKQTHRGTDAMLLVSACTDTQMQTDAQIHKYTEWWQHCDRPWMITSWPLGPSLQISLSGSKSGLSLYANQPSFNRASQPQPSSLTTSSNHSSLANNALQNQHQALQETKEVRYHSERERHELCGILSALCSICIQHDTR